MRTARRLRGAGGGDVGGKRGDKGGVRGGVFDDGEDDNDGEGRRGRRDCVRSVHAEDVVRRCMICFVLRCVVLCCIVFGCIQSREFGEEMNDRVNE